MAINALDQFPKGSEQLWGDPEEFLDGSFKVHVDVVRVYFQNIEDWLG